MPILVDFSQTVIANAYMNIRSQGQLELDLLRHQVLMSIKVIKKTQSKTYGEVILCVDSPKCWRYDVFPYYKASRAGNGESEVAKARSILSSEFANVLPYLMLKVPGCEADDIIGILVHKLARNAKERILIVSSDNDFKQLHRSNVQQMDPIRKAMMCYTIPHLALKEKILRGDVGDGVPNFLSPDNSFVDKIRQKPIMQKNFVDWMYMSPEKFCDETTIKYYNRNKQLIDLSQTPKALAAEVLEKYCDRPYGEKKFYKSKLTDYFKKNNLNMLLEAIDEF
jgi:hypothetical protein